MKKIFLIFVITLSLFGATACDTTNQPNKDNSSPTTNESPEQDGDFDLPMDEFN
jgi:hypothetical protein